MINRSWIAIPTTLFALITGAANVHALNLKQAIEQAITTNPEVLEQLNQKLSRDAEWREARAGFLPRVDIDASYGTETSDNNSTRATRFGHSRNMNRQEASLIIRQMLFDGYETESESTRQQYRSESAQFQLITRSQEITLDAIRAYIEVLRSRKLVKYAASNVEVHEKIHDQVELRSRMGADSQGSLSQIVGRLNLAYSNLEAEKNNLNDALTNFEQVIGQYPEEALEDITFDLDLPKSYRDALDQALVNHPALLAAQSDIQAVQMQQNTSKSNYYPDIELELGSEWADNQNGVRGHDNAYYAMLNLRYNLYQGGANQARIKKDAYLIQEAKQRRDVTRRKVIKSVELAWNAMESANKRANYLEKYVTATIKTRDAYDQQFKIGERTLLDLLNTENEILTAHSEDIKNHYAQILSQYSLLNSMGILLTKLQLNVVSDESE
jgi:adhesin transport system outer membrane protein